MVCHKDRFLDHSCFQYVSLIYVKTLRYYYVRCMKVGKKPIHNKKSYDDNDNDDDEKDNYNNMIMMMIMLIIIIVIIIIIIIIIII